jgi:hypothetical protein
MENGLARTCEQRQDVSHACAGDGEGTVRTTLGLPGQREPVLTHWSRRRGKPPGRRLAHACGCWGKSPRAARGGISISRIVPLRPFNAAHASNLPSLVGQGRLAPCQIQSSRYRTLQCLLSLARSSLNARGVLAQPIEPPWCGSVCPVAWEGRHREVSPYPDRRRRLATARVINECGELPHTAGFHSDHQGQANEASKSGNGLGTSSCHPDGPSGGQPRYPRPRSSTTPDYDAVKKLPAGRQDTILMPRHHESDHQGVPAGLRRLVPDR